MAAFLRAVLERPGDDGPRLVFADWLEEHGDPHGELIRVQCDLARHRIGDPARRDLEQRERRLLIKHAVAWFGPLKKLFKELPDPVRGFLPPIRVSAERALFGHWPDSPLPLRVELDHTLAANSHRDQNLAGLIEGLRFGRLTGLRLKSPTAEPARDLFTSIHHGDTAVVDAPSVLALARWACAALAAPHRRLLRALDLSGGALTPEALELLLTCSHLRGLERLALRQTGLDDLGLAKLARCPHLADLTALDLSGNDLADLTPLLAAGALPRLRHLYLSKNRHLSPWMQLELQARFGRRVRF
jgi:uncharacterized protein (TIGR02996 family)